jgi:hypothetical protein
VASVADAIMDENTSGERVDTCVAMSISIGRRCSADDCEFELEVKDLLDEAGLSIDL